MKKNLENTNLALTLSLKRRGSSFKKAFTLSEVLITLTILGIIAAITIPTLNAAAKKHSYAVAVRKIHSNLSNAVANYMAIHDYTTLTSSPMEQDGGDDYASAQEAANQFLRDNFKVTKECDSSNLDECLNSTFKTIKGGSGSLSYFAGGGDIAMVLADGSVITLSSPRRDNPLDVYIDINGKKGPNVSGYDIWYMSIYEDGTVDERSWYDEKCEDFTAYGAGCFGKLKENDWVIDW